jgi:hypothetical protein
MLHFASFAACSFTQIARQRGTTAFTVEGWRNWNIKDKSLLKHMHSKAHKLAQEKYIGFINPVQQLIIKLRSGVIRIVVFIRSG